MIWDYSSENDEGILSQINLCNLEEYLSHADLLKDTTGFSRYMRSKFKEKEITFKEVFERAHIPAKYGYKIVSEEKKTANRDLILRLCFSLGLNLMETQKALLLSDFSMLNPGIKRDVIFTAFINSRNCNIDAINSCLQLHNEKLME